LLLFALNKALFTVDIGIGLTDIVAQDDLQRNPDLVSSDCAKPAFLSRGNVLIRSNQ